MLNEIFEYVIIKLGIEKVKKTKFLERYFLRLRLLFEFCFDFKVVD